MDKNIGVIDRVARLLLGAALLAFALSGSHLWLGLVAVMSLVSAFVGTCPLYSAVGVATRRETRDTGGRLLGL